MSLSWLCRIGAGKSARRRGSSGRLERVVGRWRARRGGEKHRQAGDEEPLRGGQLRLVSLVCSAARALGQLPHRVSGGPSARLAVQAAGLACGVEGWAGGRGGSGGGAALNAPFRPGAEPHLQQFVLASWWYLTDAALRS